MSQRMQLLEEALLIVGKYTKLIPGQWRPGLTDLYVYNVIVDMHQSDYENGSTVPDYIWRKTPDEVMETIVNSSRIFDLEYGWEQLSEDIRDYLITNKFIADPLDEDEVSDDEYQTNLEGK